MTVSEFSDLLLFGNKSTVLLFPLRNSLATIALEDNPGYIFDIIKNIKVYDNQVIEYEEEMRSLKEILQYIERYNSDILGLTNKEIINYLASFIKDN